MRVLCLMFVVGSAWAQAKEPPVDPYADAWKAVVAAGEDKAKLAEALKGLDAAVEKHPSAEGHYLRGRVLAVLGKQADALAAQQTAVKLEPGHIPAQYSLGTLLANTGNVDGAMVHWTIAAKAAKPHPDAAYNAAQTHYNRGQFAEALAMWRIAQKVMPSDFDTAKKIVQALHGLGKHAEAAKAMEDVQRIWKVLRTSAKVRSKQMVIDQFEVAGRKVMVYEALEVYNPQLHYHWQAKVFGADGKPEFSVQLESSAYGREAGTPYLDGATFFASGSHKGYGTGYKALPDYGKWRELAKTRIAELIKDPSKRP